MEEPSFEFRELGPGDEALLDEALTVFKGRPSAAPDLFLADGRSHAFVALQGDRVLGWAYGHELLRPEGRWMMLLYDLEVAEDARQRGIGRALLEKFVEFARSKGHMKMWLFTDAGNEAARRLYEGAGGERSPWDDQGYWWVFE